MSSCSPPPPSYDRFALSNVPRFTSTKLSELSVASFDIASTSTLVTLTPYVVVSPSCVAVTVISVGFLIAPRRQREIDLMPRRIRVRIRRADLHADIRSR